ncbi:MAG: HAD domain-containing protein [Crocinitomicaceae bacterium]
MKIIFLDIDGVLNSDTWEKTESYRNGTYPENMFDPVAVRLLNKIIERTNAKVVLTSTWRLKFSLFEMNQLFIKVGIDCDLIDFTPDLKKNNDYTLRGNEILKWCKDNSDVIGTKYLNYTDFIILDDNSDMLYWQSKYFFQTDKLCGLSETLAREAIRMLQRNH